VTEPLFVGVDVGTQSVRACVFDLSGACLGEAATPLTLQRRGPDEVEQRPEDFYQAATRSIAACLGKSGRAKEVAGLAAAGQMAGVLGVDQDGQAITPYDSWLDSRCRSQVEEIAARMGHRVAELTGCPPMVDHAPKVAWWCKERPAVYRSVAKFVVPSAFVAGRLCELGGGDAFIDTTHLHFSGLADAAKMTWSSELADGAGVGLDKMPRIVRPTEVVGQLGRAEAQDCGLPPGIPVAAGLGDTAAGVLGAGVVGEGQLLDTAGTASVLALSTTVFVPDLSGTLVQMQGAIPGQWISLAYLAGGDLLGWLPQVLGAPLDVLLEEAATCPGGRLLFVPHLGGRILPAAPAARGAWVGLDLSQQRGDLVRAVLESVAYEFAGFLSRARATHPYVVAQDVRVIGGGGDNSLWNLIKASVLGLPYVRLGRENFTCWGAALVAAAAVGAVDDLAPVALRAAAEVGRTWPDEDLQSLYAEREQAYRGLVGMLVPGPEVKVEVGE